MDISSLMNFGMVGVILLLTVLPVAVISIWLLSLRRIVVTNEVHIIQSAKKTISYGKDQVSGNTYYAFPAWMPIIGVQVIVLPVSVFSIKLDAYDAYDSGKLKFLLDLVAFFRIEDSNVAAQRVSNVDMLYAQLKSILQGAARTILASKTIEEIMNGRSEFGEAFTKEVKEQLKAWGIATVKNIELMDIRDSENSNVIQNITDKKKSEIEMESRVIVAQNKKAAENSEIDARREVEINKQLAQQQVGVKTAEKEREVNIAIEMANQDIKIQNKKTVERQLEIDRVNKIQTAEIQRDANLVLADEKMRSEIISAEGNKRTVVLQAEANLESEKNHATAIELKGKAVAESEKLLQLAPVEAQIVLAKEIGGNNSYQQYLVTIRQIDANEKIGIEQAKSLGNADIKVIANSGSVTGGMNSLGEILSPSGGTKVAGALEAFAQSDIGKGLIENFIKK